MVRLPGGFSLNVATVLLAKCRACSHHRDPREFVSGPVIGICWHCYERHVEALAMLAGNPPRGCQECHRTIADLEAISRRAGAADTRLVLERKDGIYQILCLPCSAVYQAKRADLFRRTPYGAAMKI